MCYRPQGLKEGDQVRMNGKLYTITHITRNRLWSGHTVLQGFTVHKIITEEEHQAYMEGINELTNQ